MTSTKEIDVDMLIKASSPIPPPRPQCRNIQPRAAIDQPEQIAVQEYFEDQLRLVKMTGDGNCLFHALAYSSDTTGANLREKIIDFLEQAAPEQEHYEDTWLQESEYLRASQYNWGGDTAIVAFTLMEQRRVWVHWPDEDSLIHSMERTHEDVLPNLPPQNFDDIHLWYNGKDHYDLLIPHAPHHQPFHAQATSITDRQSSEHPEASEPQPQSPPPPLPPPPMPPPTPSPDESPATADTPPPPPPPTSAQPRPHKKHKTNQAEVATKPKATAKSKIRFCCKTNQQQTTTEQEPTEVKVTPQPSILQELSKVEVAPNLMHPRRLLEDAIRHLASEELRDDPLIPPGKCRQDIDKGEAWPRVFCAFKGCNWTTSSGSEEDLHRHVEAVAIRTTHTHIHAHMNSAHAPIHIQGIPAQETHYEKLKPAMEHMPKPKPKDITRSIYNEAVATVCRRQAPPAGCSRDRSALTSFTHAMTKDRIEALICFSCACIHTRVEEINEANSIDWYPILEPLDSKEKTEARTRNLYKILSLQKYLDTYDTLVGDIKLSSLTDFQDWQVDIPGHGAALCCPEDHRCTAHPEHPNLRTLCEKCEVPLCKDCVQHLRKGRLPPLSLCNDMWTGFAPERLYKENVTVMEMICASPCVTTLICFSMEARYGEEEKGTTAALDAKAHSALHRLGARGNALTFPMPWEELLANLKDALNAEEGPPQLPRAGQQLGEIVRVLLKTNKTRKTTASELKTLIHQATVRREVVIQLILDMKKSGHPAFQKIQAETVRRAASNLPEEGIPPEVLKVIETMQDSDDWGKLQPQKAATPVDHPHEDMHKAGEIFASQRAQGILAEGRSEERENQNAVAVAALNNLREQLTTQPHKKTDTLEVRTGNQLIDQFQPMYFATAFCFCFSHATACPDVQDTRTRKAEDDRDEKSVTNRRSRDPNAPSVQVHAWAAAMLRRAETQFRRDWTFGFTTWNFLFRTMVNLQKNTFMYATVNEQGDCRKFSNLEILHGIHEIQDALHHGKYMDLSNQIKPVKGDLSKVKYSIGLSEAAKKARSSSHVRVSSLSLSPVFSSLSLCLCLSSLSLSLSVFLSLSLFLYLALSRSLFLCLSPSPSLSLLPSFSFSIECLPCKEPRAHVPPLV